MLPLVVTVATATVRHKMGTDNELRHHTTWAAGRHATAAAVANEASLWETLRTTATSGDGRAVGRWLGRTAHARTRPAICFFLR